MHIQTPGQTHPWGLTEGVLPSSFGQGFTLLSVTLLTC